MMSVKIQNILTGQDARFKTDQTLVELFQQDPQRGQRYYLQAAGIGLDYSKNHFDQASLQQLLTLAVDQGVTTKRQDLFQGQCCNVTENQAALHTALRDFSPQPWAGQAIADDVAQEQLKLKTFAEQVIHGQWRGFSGKPIKSVVNIGIGGSDLGPKMVCQALAPYHITGLSVHFVSNVDANELYSVLATLDPETTLLIIASKTFSTQETLTNAQSAQQWLLAHYGESNQAAISHHFVAVTNAIEKATAFGIDAKHCFAMPAWVGGRYSLWSSIGLPIILAVGWANFKALLEGAHAMDQHFYHAETQANMPIILALMGILNHNIYGHPTQAILPYDTRLEALPNYLQQADMESNGKSCQNDGKPVQWQTGPVIWGGVGTNGQHAFHQLLHQGTQVVPADFIAIARPAHQAWGHHQKLLAHCFAQSEALMVGVSKKQKRQQLIDQGLEAQHADWLAAHQAVAGNKPSNTLLIDALTPERLGALIALYEHKIFVQGIIWQINSYDQWGVELGKQLSKPLLTALESKEPILTHLNQSDGSTQHLLEKIKTIWESFDDTSD